jgi:RNA polymerase sigma-70 factor (ECF subfamily)
MIDGRADSASRHPEPGEGYTARTLWDTHRRWVAAILLAHKPAWADVEDLLQDVALAVTRTVKDLREPGSVKPWLRTIAINAALAAARGGKKFARTRALEVEHEGVRTARTGQSAGERLREQALERDRAERGRELMELLTRLPEGYREPLLLKSVQGMSTREIGVVMGLPESTVETRIARARRMLRELADQPPAMRLVRADANP